MMQDLETVKDTIESNPGKAVAAVATTVVAVGVLRRIIQWFKAPNPYSDKDIARHYLLKAAYTKLRASPPADWGLDSDHRPLLTTSLKEIRANLYEKKSNVDSIISASIHQNARNMLDTVIKLVDSLSKRKNHPLKKGCIEILFFTELSDWILTKVPFYRYHDKKTLAELCAREDYFQKVLDTILEPDNGVNAGERNSPIVALKQIIEELKGIIETSEELIEAQTFSDHISELDNAIVSMGAEIFHAMFLLTEGNHNYELALPVGLFLDRSQIHRPSLTALQEKRLAYWLEQTLRLLGIESNDFINTKIVTLDMIDQHLADELTKHPTFPKKLLAPGHLDWGHWLFLFKNDPSAASKQLALEERLNDIRTIYQQVLSLYYLRGLLAHARSVAPVSGEVWLYGDKTGHAVVTTLMDISTKILSKLETSVVAFHEKNKDRFESLRSAGFTQYGSESYTSVAAAHARLEEYKVQNLRGKRAIAAINQQRDSFDTRLSSAKESRQELIQDIVAFMDHHEMKVSRHYPILIEALKRSEPRALGSGFPLPNGHGSVGSGAILHRDTLEHKLKRKLMAQAYYSGADVFFDIEEDQDAPLIRPAGIVSQVEKGIEEAPKSSVVLTAFHALYALFVKQGLTPKERVRYHGLIQAYEQLLGDNPPPAWALIDKSPLLDQNFDTLKFRLQAQLSSLSKIAPASIHQSAEGILTAIVKLYDSLSKRRSGKIKIISVEELFFSELACWIVNKLPTYDFKSPSTLYELNKMLTYCNNVHKNILIPERNSYLALRNNPLPVLRHITHDLEGIIKATTELVHSATLNDRLYDLDNAILTMAAQTFHVMYLLINGDHRYESGLTVGLFLDEKQQSRPKISEIKKQQLSSWLKRVLDKLGIIGNDFKQMKKPTLSEIDALFAGECPTDRDCRLPGKLRDANAADWGHWLFLLKSDYNKDRSPQEVCSEQLLKIRQVYQNLMKLYDLRHFISHARKVAPVYGEVSLYGDTTGRAIMDMLIHISKDTTANLAGTLDSFFYDQYKNFSNLKASSKTNPDDKGYIAMGSAYQQMKIFEEQYQKGQQAIEEIIKQSKTATSRIEKAETSKTQLLIELVHFSKQRNLPLSRDLEAAYERLQEDPFQRSPEFVQLVTAASPRIVTAFSSTPLEAVVIARCHQIRENSTLLDLSKLTAHRRPPSNGLYSQASLIYPPEERGSMDGLFSRHLKSIKTPITSIDFSNNGSQNPHSIARTALNVFCTDIQKAPSTVQTVDLRGNGLESHTKEELAALLTSFPKTMKVYLHGERALSVQDQLTRLTWPQSYHRRAEECKGNLIELARLLLNDYTKGNSVFMRFVTFSLCHHHIQLAEGLENRIKKKEFPSVTALLKELYQIEPINPTGELSKRLSFFYYHAYHQLKFENFHGAVTLSERLYCERSIVGAPLVEL